VAVRGVRIRTGLQWPPGIPVRRANRVRDDTGPLHFRPAPR